MIAWLSAIVVAFVLSGCEAATISSDWHRVHPPITAPEFTLSQLEGPPIALADLRGRVVVMEFWATWCGPCRQSLPSLEVIYKHYQTKGLTVLLINAGERPEQIHAWLERRYTAPILLDAQHEVGEAYRVQGIPQLFVIDQEGQIVYTHAGYGGGLEQNLKLLLKDLLHA